MIERVHAHGQRLLSMGDLALCFLIVTIVERGWLLLKGSGSEGAK